MCVLFAEYRECDTFRLEVIGGRADFSYTFRECVFLYVCTNWLVRHEERRTSADAKWRGRELTPECSRSERGRRTEPQPWPASQTSRRRARAALRAREGASLSGALSLRGARGKSFFSRGVLFLVCTYIDTKSVVRWMARRYTMGIIRRRQCALWRGAAPELHGWEGRGWAWMSASALRDSVMNVETKHFFDKFCFFFAGNYMLDEMRN